MPPMIDAGLFASGDYPKSILITNTQWVRSRTAPSQGFIPWWRGGDRGEQGDDQGWRSREGRRSRAALSRGFIPWWWTGDRGEQGDIQGRRSDFTCSAVGLGKGGQQYGWNSYAAMLTMPGRRS